MDPVFLTFEEVLEINLDQVRRYGGTAGVRDEGLLLSALAMPQAGFGDQYAHVDLFEMAAAYLQGRDRRGLPRARSRTIGRRLSLHGHPVWFLRNTRCRVPSAPHLHLGMRPVEFLWVSSFMGRVTCGFTV